MQETLPDNLEYITGDQRLALIHLIGEVAIIQPSGEDLTPQEHRILESILAGENYRDTNRRLNIYSRKFIRIQAPKSIRSKLGARNNLHLPRLALEEGLVALQSTDSSVPIGQRQSEIVSLMSLGASKQEISKILDISPGTASGLAGRLFNRLGATNQINGVYRALSTNFVIAQTLHPEASPTTANNIA